MTKTEIANTLARQFAEAEERYFENSQLRDDARSRGAKDERMFYRSLAKTDYSIMLSIMKSAELLGIDNNQWYEGLTQAYKTMFPVQSK